MKKKLFLLLVLLIPVLVNAKTYYDDYNTLNLKEALAEEDIPLQNKDYKEDDKQAIVYLFRGNGCGYCRNFLTFLSSITKDYGKYFRVVSFEVWGDKKNSELLSKMPKVTGEDAGGVPYIIIGSKVFGGYSSSYDSEIKQAIMDEYNNPSEDVFSKLEKYDNGEFTLPDTKDDSSSGSGSSKNYGSSGSDNFAIGFWNFIFIAGATFAIIYFNNKNTKKILDALEDKKEEKKEEKKDDKKKDKKKD